MSYVPVHAQLVAEQGQRWLCASYNPRSTAIIPYSFKDEAVGVQGPNRPKLLFFRFVYTFITPPRPSSCIPQAAAALSYDYQRYNPRSLPSWTHATGHGCAVMILAGLHSRAISEIDPDFLSPSYWLQSTERKGMGL